MVSKLGTQADQARASILDRELEDFTNDPPIAQRIIRDKPIGWEYRLTAVYLTDFLKAPMRKWYDLSRGLYSKPKAQIEDDVVFDWFAGRMSDVSELVPPLENLLNNEFQRSWGPPGEAHEIRHLCQLVKKAVDRIIEWEESVHFVMVPEKFERLHSYLPGTIGSQLKKLQQIPHDLNNVVDWAEENPGVKRQFYSEVVIELPEEWTEKVEEEIQRLTRRNFWS